VTVGDLRVHCIVREEADLDFQIGLAAGCTEEAAGVLHILSDRVLPAGNHEEEGSCPAEVGCTGSVHFACIDRVVEAQIGLGRAKTGLEEATSIGRE